MTQVKHRCLPPTVQCPGLGFSQGDRQEMWGSLAFYDSGLTMLCYATRRQCYQDKGPSWSSSWLSLPNLLIWQENAGNSTLYIQFKGNAPDTCDSKIHFSWLSSIDPNLNQYFKMNIFTKRPPHSLSTWYLHFCWPLMHWTSFLEETSSCLALDFLQHLVPFKSQDRQQDFFPGEQHCKQRKMLNPVFSTTHLRDMSKFWLFFWSPRAKCAIVPTFYCVSYKVPDHLNLLNWR